MSEHVYEMRMNENWRCGKENQIQLWGFQTGILPLRQPSLDIEEHVRGLECVRSLEGVGA